MTESTLRGSGYLAPNETIRLADQGDREAFALIYKEHSDRVYRICRRMLRNPAEAEDAAQDVFVRVLLKIHTFRGESAFSSWLYRLTTNVVLMRFRKAKHNCTAHGEPIEDKFDITSIPGGLDLQIKALSIRIDLEAAIDELPEGYRAAFILHDVHGYAHREIAAILGYSVGSSKSQLHKARTRLRKLLAIIPKDRMRQNADSTACA